jgi:hypothetical protein
VGRVQNLRLRQWRRTHLVHALRDKAERAGMIVRMWTSAAAPPPAQSAEGRFRNQRPPLLLSALPVPRAPGSGRCRQHRRHPRRRTHEYSPTCARRAPPGRYRAGTT